MSDVCVTVPMRLWEEWIDEGDLPGEPYTGDTFHFWLGGPLPEMQPGERVYVVAHGRLRGYAPLVGIEQRCRRRSSYRSTPSPDADELLTMRYGTRVYRTTTDAGAVDAAEAESGLMRGVLVALAVEVVGMLAVFVAALRLAGV
jgi:hypothetical protein